MTDEYETILDNPPPGGWTDADKVPEGQRKLYTPPPRPRVDGDGNITIGGRKYRVEALEPGSDENAKGMFPYKLTGVRGAQYLLTRNVPTPHLLLAVNVNFLKGTPFDKGRHSAGWFSDEDGTLTYLG